MKKLLLCIAFIAFSISAEDELSSFAAHDDILVKQLASNFYKDGASDGLKLFSIESLGKMGERGVGGLTDVGQFLFNKDNDKLRLAAVNAIQNIVNSQAGTQAVVTSGERAFIITTLEEMALEDQNPQIRLASVNTLATMFRHAPVIANNLAGITSSEDAKIRTAAMNALIGDGGSDQTGSNQSNSNQANQNNQNQNNTGGGQQQQRKPQKEEVYGVGIQGEGQRRTAGRVGFSTQRICTGIGTLMGRYGKEVGPKKLYIIQPQSLILDQSGNPDLVANSVSLDISFNSDHRAGRRPMIEHGTQFEVNMVVDNEPFSFGSTMAFVGEKIKASFPATDIQRFKSLKAKYRGQLGSKGPFLYAISDASVARQIGNYIELKLISGPSACISINNLARGSAKSLINKPPRFDNRSNNRSKQSQQKNTNPQQFAK